MAAGAGARVTRSNCPVGVGLLLGVLEMFWKEVVAMVAQPYEYTKNYSTVPFKRMSSVACE